MLILIGHSHVIAYATCVTYTGAPDADVHNFRVLGQLTSSFVLKSARDAASHRILDIAH